MEKEAINLKGSKGAVCGKVWREECCDYIIISKIKNRRGGPRGRQQELTFGPLP